MKRFKYVIQDKEAGNKIANFDTLDEAEKALTQYELDDKEEGIYTPEFYEIVEVSE